MAAAQDQRSYTTLAVIDGDARGMRSSDYAVVLRAVDRLRIAGLVSPPDGVYVAPRVHASAVWNASGSCWSWGFAGADGAAPMGPAGHGRRPASRNRNRRAATARSGADSRAAPAGCGTSLREVRLEPETRNSRGRTARLAPIPASLGCGGPRGLPAGPEPPAPAPGVESDAQLRRAWGADGAEAPVRGLRGRARPRHG